MAAICNNCGYAYNQDNADHCAVCNGPLNPAGIGIPLQTGSDRIESINQGVAESGYAGSAAFTFPSSQNTRDHFSQSSHLEGRISHLERHDERPQRDGFQTAAKLLIGVLIFIPFFAIFIITGCLSFVFAILGFRVLSNFFNPFIWFTAIFEFLEVLVLSRIRGSGTVPIYRGMVEDNHSQEHAFMFRGPMRAGNLVAGHNVRFDGSRERGTFIIQHGMDLTSNSEIVSDYRNPWKIIFYGVLLLYFFIGVEIYLQLPEIMKLKGYFG